MSEENHFTFKYIKKMAGEELRRVRIERGLSLEEAAQAAEIHNPAVIKKLEEGHSSHILCIFDWLRLTENVLKLNWFSFGI